MSGSALDRLAKRAEKRPVTAEPEVDIPLAKIRFDPKQPRKAFHHLDGRVSAEDEAAVEELAESIKQNKLIQAITVRELPDGTYVVVVGERRTRAHLKLNAPTIRAVVRNDLNDPALRLLYQLAENVNREDLPESELSDSVRVLLDGTDEAAPLSQAQIATHLGKKEGWITRLVRFGDAELRRLWVDTGIATKAENLYRLSLLPEAYKVEIRRRVELPEGHPDRLDKPLSRKIIDSLSDQAKIEKRAKKNGGGQQESSQPVDQGDGKSQETAETPAGQTDVATADTNGVSANDTIGQALAAAAAEGRQTEERKDAGKSSGEEIGGQGYALPPGARDSLIGGAAAAAGTESSNRAPVQPPVNCRVAVKNLVALFEVVKENPDLQAALADAWCEMKLQGELAQNIANALKGIVVDPKEVPATVQAELTKLQ